MSISDCYFIWGEEEYLIDQEINRILLEIEQQNGEEPEKISLDADELEAQGLAQTLEFSPLFSTSRVVVIKKPFWLAKSNRKMKKMEEAGQVIKDYLNQTGSGQTLILTFPERNASNSLVKFLDKRAQVINCKTPDSKYLANWITEEFKRCRREVNLAAVSLLAKSGQNMYYLKNTISKISLIVNNRVINETDVSDQLNTKHEINIFKLTDALLNRNLQSSLQAYNQLLTQGEHPILLLNMIARQFTILGKVKGYMEKGFSKKQIEEYTEQKEFVVRKMMEKCPSFSREDLRRLFYRFLETDYGFKTSGRDERILTELLIIDICAKK